MGFTRENKIAMGYFNNKNYECIESSYRYEQNPKHISYVNTDYFIMIVDENLKEEYF